MRESILSYFTNEIILPLIGAPIVHFLYCCQVLFSTFEFRPLGFPDGFSQPEIGVELSVADGVVFETFPETSHLVSCQ